MYYTHLLLIEFSGIICNLYSICQKIEKTIENYITYIEKI